MTLKIGVENNALHDSTVIREQQDVTEVSTLEVGRNASLVLGTDSLTVLNGEPLKNGKKRSNAVRSIPFYNILWVELSDFDIIIQYAMPKSKDVVRLTSIRQTVEEQNMTRAAAWITKLLNRAYGSSKRNKRIKVLVNPHGGVGSAPTRYRQDIEPILSAARCELDTEETKYQGHATKIAEDIDINAFDVIVCCSGDGLPHEVFNGLSRKPNAIEALSKIAVVQLPCGSGNAMSWSLNATGSPSIAALCTVKGLRTPLDLASVTQDDRRTISFLSQSFGLVADADLGTDNIRWMGSARFTYGMMVRILRKTVYPCDLAIKVEIGDKSRIREHYLVEVGNEAPESARRGTFPSSTGLPPLRYGSVRDDLPSDWDTIPYGNLSNFFAGNMPLMTADAHVFPATLPNDGFLDLVTFDGDMSRRSTLQCFLAAGKGTVFDLPDMNFRKISGYRLVPQEKKDGYISIDGERIPFEPFQVEVHKGLGTVLSKSGHMYEAKAIF